MASSSARSTWRLLISNFCIRRQLRQHFTTYDINISFSASEELMMACNFITENWEAPGKRESAKISGCIDIRITLIGFMG